MNELHQLVGRSRLAEAVKFLLNATSDSQNKNDGILLQGKLNTLKRNERMGIISSADAGTERAKITHAILQLGAEIEQESNTTTTISTNPPPTIKENNTINPITKILFLAANPFDTGRLRLDKEFREIDEALKRASKRELFDLNSRFAVRPKDLRYAMLEDTPNIIHFSGHGLSENSSATSSSTHRGLVLKGEESALKGGIILENDQGESHYVKGSSLAKLFQLFSENIQAVLLNSCYSESQAQAILPHVPYVIGMNQEVEDSSAIAFASSFYDAIGAGKSIEFSFQFAQVAIDFDNLKGAAIPQLLKNEALIKEKSLG